MIGPFRSGGGGLERQRDAVHAIAQAGRLRPVVEDVAEMAAAAAAMDRGADHAEGWCRWSSPTALSSGAQKLGQPVPLSNLVVEEKQIEVAAGAGEDALAVLVAAAGW